MGEFAGAFLRHRPDSSTQNPRVESSERVVVSPEHEKKHEPREWSIQGERKLNTHLGPNPRWPTWVRVKRGQSVPDSRTRKSRITHPLDGSCGPPVALLWPIWVLAAARQATPTSLRPLCSARVASNCKAAPNLGGIARHNSPAPASFGHASRIPVRLGVIKCLWCVGLLIPSFLLSRVTCGTRRPVSKLPRD